MLEFDGYHGTSLAASKSILIGQFNKSDSKKEWLGRGIYFFVDGISDPLENAKVWAICQAWDNLKRINKYDDFAVLKSEILLNEDSLIDLTSLDGLKAFNEIKEQFFKKLINLSIQLAPIEEQNCILFNFIVELLDAKAVKHHLYIQNKRERRSKLQLNVPNTTVLCLVDQSRIVKTETVLEEKVK